MISLSLGHLPFAYAGVLVALLFLLWLLREVLRGRREKRSRRRGIQCAICGTLYEDSSPEPTPVCPQCGQRNERFVPPGI